MSWKLAELRWRQDAGLSDGPLKRWGNLEAIGKRDMKPCCEEGAFSAEEEQEGKLCLPKEHRAMDDLQPAGQDAKFRCRTRLSRNLPQTSTPPPRPPPFTTRKTSCASSSSSSVTPLLQPSTSFLCSSVKSLNRRPRLESPSSVVKSDSGAESTPIHQPAQQARDFLWSSDRPFEQSELPCGRQNQKPSATNIAVGIFIDQDLIWPPQRSQARLAKYSINLSLSSVFPKPPQRQPHFEKSSLPKALVPDPKKLESPEISVTTSSIDEPLRCSTRILELEQTIFELLNAHESLVAYSIVSPEDSDPRSAISRAADTFDMSNKGPFDDDRAPIPPKRKDTPPRTIFPDLEAAHTAIVAPRIPSTSPGMEYQDDEHAMLPPCIDLPQTPEKPRLGPASRELRERLASSSSQERPLSPLLPPTSVYNISSTSSSPTSYNRHNAVRLHRIDDFADQDKAERDLSRVAILTGFGQNDIPLRRLRRVASVESGLRQPDLFAQAQHAFPSPSLPGRAQQDDWASTVESIAGRYGGSEAQPASYAGLGQQRRAGWPIGVAVPEESDWAKHTDRGSEFSGVAAAPKPLRRLRSATAGMPPEKPLPPLPQDRLPYGLRDVKDIYSVSGRYGDTESLLNIQPRRRLFGSQSHPAESSTQTSYMPAEHSGRPRAVVGRNVMDDIDEAFKAWGVAPENVRTSVNSLDLARLDVPDDRPSFFLGRDDDGILRVESSQVEPEIVEKKNFPEPGLSTQASQTTQTRRAKDSAQDDRVDDDNDWETIRSQFDTDKTLRHVSTEQSLANVSSYESLSRSARPVSPWGPLARTSGSSYYHSVYEGAAGDLADARARGLELHTSGIDGLRLPYNNAEHSLFPPKPAFLAQTRLETPSSRRRQQPQFHFVDNPFFSSSPPTTKSSPAQQSSTLLPSRVRPIMAPFSNLPGDDKATPSRPSGITVEDLESEACTSATAKDGELVAELASDIHDQELREARAGKRRADPIAPELETTPAVAGSTRAAALREARAGKKRADEQSHYSKASDDGSYPTDDASEAGLIRERAPKTSAPKDTYKKRSVLGPKANITGTLRGTGMRETGSSPANRSDSIDVAGNETMTSEALEAEFAKRIAQMDKYKALDDLSDDEPMDWSALYEPGKVPAGLSSGAKKDKKEEKKKFPGGWSLPMHGLVNTFCVDRRVHTGVACSDGATISAPQPIHERPWNLAPGNTFELNIIRETSRVIPVGRLAARLAAANTDILRLKSECPIFPLSAAHAALTFDNPRLGRVGRARAERNLNSAGVFEEQMFCRKHLRWEFGGLATLPKDKAVREGPGAAAAAAAVTAAEKDPLVLLVRVAVVTGALFVVVLAVLLAVLLRT